MTKKPDNSALPRRDCQIHTTGATCEPLRIRHRDGRISWHWVVTEFTDDSYHQGRWVNPQEAAEFSEDLFPEGEQSAR